MRRWRIALATGLLAAGLPAMAQALVFTMSASPLVVAVGDVTEYTFTFTNLDTSLRVRCVEVLFPDEFWGLTNTGTPSASNGRPWSASLLGQWVLVRSNTSAGRLRTNESVTFTVSALATTSGAYTFDNHVHITSVCGGPNDPNINGVPVPLTVLPTATPTASPTPTPTVAPTATPTPTPTPTPTATPKPTAVPTPVPTPRQTAAATPDRSTPTPTPTATPTQEASASPRPSAVPSPSPSSPGQGQTVRVAPLTGGSASAPTSLGVGVDILGVINGPLGWFVPGAAVGVPGLLVLIFVGLQALGAMAWIPAVRRMGDDDDDRERRGRRPTRSP